MQNLNKFKLMCLESMRGGMLLLVSKSKCVPLHPFLNRSRYAYRKVRVRTDYKISPTEEVRAQRRQVERQNPGLVDDALWRQLLKSSLSCLTNFSPN